MQDNITIKKEPMVEQAYQSLTELILSLKLPPGQSVSDASLAQELQMSRTPVREALVRLMGDGLIVSNGNKMFVSQISVKDIREICQAREGIEGMAAYLLASRGVSEDQKKRLIQIHENLVECVNTNNAQNSYPDDDSFHLEIVTYSDNTRLVEFFNKLRLQICRSRWLTLLTPACFTNTVIEHEAILESILKGDPEKAVKAVRNHLQSSQRNYENILETMPWHNVLMGLTTIRRGE